MDLFPIRVALPEVHACAQEIFFIDRRLFSPAYFASSIALVLGPLLKKQEGVLDRESMLLKIYKDIGRQISQYSADVDAFNRKHPGKRLDVALDFKVDGFIRIEDRVTLTLPLGSDPDVYAKDLFKAHQLPPGEVQTMFIFYFREEILRRIKKVVHEKPHPKKEVEKNNENFQIKTPTVTLSTTPEKLSQGSFYFDASGKVLRIKEERKKRKRSML
ncbi:hypothetical protein NEDG_00892 [Nematocida displodere]|uniref:Uncharacterized protein n=1 Tax=Nematocida displodere TaxID=1805483 RepID=A0A177EFJ1_9MICR|nr:hypothetical protein NEDG_00892 [Nematocida displodere]